MGGEAVSYALRHLIALAVSVSLLDRGGHTDDADYGGYPSVKQAIGVVWFCITSFRTSDRLTYEL